VDVYAALADPTRREIVTLLAQGERTAGDLARRFPIAGPSVSRHLKVLRDSGVISYRPVAQTRVYRLESSILEEANSWMQAQLDVLHQRFDRLGQHLDHMKESEERHG
jgi:DNA-binding transcriptional ArsR family regulator